ncbi:MAG: leucine-rich repeat domain-containing protein [Oscillospiraceae bacterium]|nr:leucine-rich repeat domain-containing protein [Oscillospiraceae bacterium]
MKRKLLAILAAMSIIAAAVPTVSMADEGALAQNIDVADVLYYKTVSSLKYGPVYYLNETEISYDDWVSFTWTPRHEEIPGIYIFVHDDEKACNVNLYNMTDSLLAEWVANGMIPSNTALIKMYLLNPLLPRLTDISPLAELPQLEWLNASKQNISDLSPLAKLTNLTDLILFDNPVNDISPLSGLPNLQRLSLSGGSISDLSPLSKVKSLKVLDLDNCQITDVSPLAELPKLWYVHLFDNPELDLKTLRALKHIDFVIWEGNPNEPNSQQLTKAFMKYGEPTMADALAILRYCVNLPSVLDESDYAFAAACIVSENEPGLADALQIMRYCVKMPSVFDE